MSPSSLAQGYLATLHDLLRRIESTEAEHIEGAAPLLADWFAQRPLSSIWAFTGPRRSPSSSWLRAAPTEAGSASWWPAAYR